MWGCVSSFQLRRDEQGGSFELPSAERLCLFDCCGRRAQLSHLSGTRAGAGRPNEL
jgi:hypothetical protein